MSEKCPSSPSFLPSWVWIWNETCIPSVYYLWHCCLISTKFCHKDNKSLRHPWGVLCHLLVPPVVHQCLLSNDSADQCWVIFIFANQDLPLSVCIRLTCIAYKQNISLPPKRTVQSPTTYRLQQELLLLFRNLRFTLFAQPKNIFLSLLAWCG